MPIEVIEDGMLYIQMAEGYATKVEELSFNSVFPFSPIVRSPMPVTENVMELHALKALSPIETLAGKMILKRLLHP